MKSNFLSDKLDELYKKEQYQHPIQKRTPPDVSITGAEPDEDELSSAIINPTKIDDEDDVKKDLGNKGNKTDLGLKGNEKDLGTFKKSDPKEWNFDGPRVSIHQEK